MNSLNTFYQDLRTLVVMEDLKEICVTDEEQKLYFEIENDVLALSDLRRYFPFALGLNYTKINRTIIVNAINNQLQIPKEIKELNLQLSRDKPSVEEKLHEYFYLTYTYKEISALLKSKYDMSMSARKIRRYYKEKNWKRKRIIESPTDLVVAAIMHELKNCGMNLGYRFMWHRLRQKYRFNVKQSTVLKMMRVIDPIGVEERLRYRLRRRRYKVPGPNYIYHIDGFDKLKKFGFAIHGCVDGYSKRVMWLHVATTNNKPQVIAYYYLKCILEYKLLPNLIRSDRGTENSLVDLLHMALRYYHTDDNAGTCSFIKGKSTANERIEKYWNHLRKHTIEFYISLFKTMQDDIILDISSAVHIECLRFCFGPLIKHDLQCAKNEWNRHRIRRQNNTNLPSGIPNVMFYWPEKSGGQDCSFKVHQENIEILLHEYTQEGFLYNSSTEKLVKLIVPNVSIICNAEEAYNLFIKVTNIINDLDQQ